MRTIEPATTDDVVAALVSASAAGERVRVHGAATKIDRLPIIDTADLRLSTRGLSRLVAHRHGDLTATIEAGAVLDEVNAALGQYDQWLPLDPFGSDRATVGGIVATNDSGPRRLRFGAPRDLIIGVEMARIDGVRASAGGIVVKNVAGYDLSRLLTGSYGCLAVILSATFKLYPRPACSRTVVVDEFRDGATMRAIVAALDERQLTPTAVEVQAPPARLLIRFEAIEASVAHQSSQLVAVAEARGLRATVVDGSDEAELWRAHGARAWTGDGAVVRVTCLPDHLAPTLDAIANSAGDCAFDITGRAALGVLLVRLEGDATAQARTIRTLRERSTPGHGSVVVLRASRSLAEQVDLWGPMGSAFRVMQAVKHAFDPDRRLNPGRGPGGL